MASLSLCLGSDSIGSVCGISCDRPPDLEGLRDRVPSAGFCGSAPMAAVCLYGEDIFGLAIQLGQVPNMIEVGGDTDNALEGLDLKYLRWH